MVEDSAHQLALALRTLACDRTVQAFSTQQRLLPKDLPEGTSRVTAPHRVTEPTPKGQKVGRYGSSRADHYFFAECYDLLAHEVKSGAPPAERWIMPPPTVYEEIHSRGVWGTGPLRGWP